MTSHKENYIQLDQKEHVLKRADMYVSNVVDQEMNEYVVKDNKIVLETWLYNAGLIRLFIEIISNATDNVFRSARSKSKCDLIKIEVNKTTCKIWNNGQTIPLKINKQTQMYNPQMIFGNLLTSSNYENDDTRISAGKNGLGSKLTNIFSKDFKVTVCDQNLGKLYKQEWKNNMSIVSEPEITETDQKNFVEIEWTVDFERFGIEHYTESTLAHFHKLACDAAMFAGIPVQFNDETIKITSLLDYVKLYVQDETLEESLLYKDKDLEVALLPSESREFMSSTFVNGIQVNNGVHLDAMVESFFRPIVESLNGDIKKAPAKAKTKTDDTKKPRTKKTPTKDTPKINISNVKNKFAIFIKLTAISPTFSSQSKTTLTGPKMPVRKIESKYINKILKWSVVDELKAEMASKSNNAMKQIENKKGFVKIAKYDRANYAGTKQSQDCTLIICEGDSAKTFCVLGIENECLGHTGRNYWGIMPIKGKGINVQNASESQIAANTELIAIIRALGVKSDVDYTIEANRKQLNYGRLMVLSDSDTVSWI